MHVPNGASGFYLLGNVCEKQNKTKEAIEYYKRTLDLDPTNWCAFERLCKLDP
jgi:tetratricopeptide (TPR) repeat protein